MTYTVHVPPIYGGKEVKYEINCSAPYRVLRGGAKLNNLLYSWTLSSQTAGKTVIAIELSSKIVKFRATWSGVITLGWALMILY